MALNDYAQLELKQKFQTLDDAVALLMHGDYLAKIDLRSAYRSVPVCPTDFPATGLKWRFKGDTCDSFMIDKRLPFGARFSPGVFHRITQCIRRFMARRGFRKIIVYLDEFLIMEDSWERSAEAQNTLIRLLHALGFDIAWDKVEGPSQDLVFLGVEIDTVRDLLVLPQAKLGKFAELIDSVLGSNRISLKNLQALAGKLNWASSVIRGGRTYLRRILDVMKPLKKGRHKLKITAGMRQDLLWWKQFLCVFNGKRMIEYQVPEVHYIFVDACEIGGGCYYRGDWQYVVWRHDVPHIKTAHINVKEGMMVLVAAYRWKHLWNNAKVVVRIDNVTGASGINEGTSRCAPLMDIVRELFWLSVLNNFEVKCWYLPGMNKWLADALSRLHEPGKIDVLARWFSWDCWGFKLFWPFLFRQCMSYSTFLSIVPQVLRWLNSGKSTNELC
jgi:hypothetical protein